MTIQNYRAVLRPRRSFHSFQPSPRTTMRLPREVAYVQVAVAAGLLAVFALAALIVPGLAGVLPFRMYWTIPFVAAYYADRVDFEGRPPWRWLLGIGRYVRRPRRSIAGRPVHRDRVTLSGRVVCWWDERTPRVRRARIHGPARVTFNAPVRLALGAWRKGWTARPHDEGRTGEYDVDERLDLRP